MPDAAPLARFEWERIMPRNQWEQLIRALPGTSPLFGHKLCGPGRCRRKDGSQLHASTIKSGAYALATFAKPDGTGAHPGIGAPRQSDEAGELRGLMLATCRSKITVIAVLRHLETVGLIIAQVRAGAMGTPREHATIWCLASPPLDTLQAAAPSGVYDFFAHHDDAGTG